MAVRQSDLHRLLKTNTESRYFFITNDPHESDWIIDDDDTEELKNAKKTLETPIYKIAKRVVKLFLKY